MREPLSVVVPTRDRPQLLDACLASVGRALAPGDELLVVDSASRQAEATAGVARAHRAHLLRCDRRGASRARNLGWQAASCALVAFVDDDVRVDRAWAEGMVAAFADSRVSFVTGRVALPEGVTAERPVAIVDGLRPIALGPGHVGILGHGANLGVRRQAISAIGGYDEVLGAGGALRAAEDLDLLDRLLAHGFTGRYEPSALAWHEQWRSRRQLLALDWSYGVGGGARLAKLARHDMARARREAGTLLWDWTLSELWPDLRAGYEFLAACVLLRAAGALVGLARGVSRRVVDGHYQPRTFRP
jgi:GT2 family glycosyltransferase